MRSSGDGGLVKMRQSLNSFGLGQCGGPHISETGQEMSGRVVPELFEVVDHVHLVVVAEAVCDVGPRVNGSAQFEVERALKASYAGVEFGGHADGLPEATLELTDTERMIRCQSLHRDGTVMMEDVIRCMW